jgi:hypothetical protein
VRRVREGTTRPPWEFSACSSADGGPWGEGLELYSTFEEEFLKQTCDFGGLNY